MLVPMISLVAYSFDVDLGVVVLVHMFPPPSLLQFYGFV